MKHFFLSLLLLTITCSAIAQQKIDSTKYSKLVTFTAQQDHDNMKQQLGIKKLRPGPSGNESAPNHANYDELIANPCSQLPDILTLKNGKKVATADMWWKERRPELIEDFEREVYGSFYVRIQIIFIKSRKNFQTFSCTILCTGKTVLICFYPGRYITTHAIFPGAKPKQDNF